MEPTYEQPVEETIIPQKVGFWTKFGGGALSIAIIFHVILAVIGGVFIAQRIFQPPPEIDFLPAGGSSSAGDSRSVSVTQQKLTQITPTTSVKRVVAEGAASSFSIPDPGDNFGEMSPLSSSLAGGASGGGLTGSGGGGGAGGSNSGSVFGGAGGGTGKLFNMIPDAMRKRCSKEDRLARLKENGGTPECEEAALKGLRWLKSKQNPDGSWGTANKNAMTGLVLLAYFGHCETPVSEEFGQSCLAGIVYLVNFGAKKEGALSPTLNAQSSPYEHGICTYALGEAATFCHELKIEIPSLMEVTAKAGQIIIDNQNINGGWAYGYSKIVGGHTDSSVVGWQLQALKACSHATHIKYKGMDKAVKDGLNYLSGLQNDNGGFGYNNTGPRIGTTAISVLCFQMWEKGKSKEVRKGVDYMKENLKLNWDTADSDLYAHYYASQAMMQAGGGDWKFYNNLFRDQVLKNQNPDGSWKPATYVGHGQTVANDIYRNALCVLMLEVYYRFLSTGGGSSKGSSRPSI